MAAAGGEYNTTRTFGDDLRDVQKRMEAVYKQLRNQEGGIRFWDCAKCFERCLFDIFNACMQEKSKCVDPTDGKQPSLKPENKCSQGDIARNHKFWYKFCAQNFAHSSADPSLVKQMELHKSGDDGIPQSAWFCIADRQAISRLTNLFYGLRCLCAHGNAQETLNAGALAFASLSRLSVNHFTFDANISNTDFLTQWLAFLDDMYGKMASKGTDFDPDYRGEGSKNSASYLISWNAASFYTAVIGGLVEHILNADCQLAQKKTGDELEETLSRVPYQFPLFRYEEMSNCDDFVVHKPECGCSVRRQLRTSKENWVIHTNQWGENNNNFCYTEFSVKGPVTTADEELNVLKDKKVFKDLTKVTVRRAQCLLVDRPNIALAIPKRHTFIQGDVQTPINRKASSCLSDSSKGSHIRRLALAMTEGMVPGYDETSILPFCQYKETKEHRPRIFQSTDVYDIPGGRVYFGEKLKGAQIRILKYRLNMIDQYAQDFVKNAKCVKVVHTRQEDIYIF